MATLIVTGAGGNVALGGLRSCDGHHVVGCDIRAEHNAAPQFVDRFVVAPRSLESLGLVDGKLTCTPSAVYREFITALVAEEGASALLAIPDWDVLALAHWPELPRVSTGPAPLLLAHDKYAAGRALAAASMATPHVWLPREVDDDMAASGALMVKHRWGAGGQGNRPLTPGNLGELGEREIVTERVEGDEHAVFLTYDRGEVALEGAFQKVLYFAGEGRRNLTVDRPELRELARAAVAALTPEPHGTYHVDIMGDRVLEINAGRAFGGTPDPYLCWAAGISMPETLLKIATGEKWEYQRVPGGIRMTHFNNYLFEHAGREWLFRG